MTAPHISSLSVLGLGTMGAALAHSWLAAGHAVTVWNRSPGRADALAAAGATVASSPAEAVAANRLTVACLLDDDSVRAVLEPVDLTGRDLVNLTTVSPAQARHRADWARGRGARFLAGGIMAIPPMIGRPESGAYVLYSGSTDAFAAHRDVLAVPAATDYVGADAGLAAVHDMALLSAMYGQLAGITHALALVDAAGVPPTQFADRLRGWLTAMVGALPSTARQVQDRDYTTGVSSSLAMQAAGSSTLLRTAAEYGLRSDLIAPFLSLMQQRVADGHGRDGIAGVVELLRR